MANELTIIDNYCIVTQTSLSFKREVTKEEWQKVFDACHHVEGCIQFWIGDLLKYREQKWGMYDDIAEETGLEKNTLRKYADVSDRLKSDLRRSDLSFSHHEQVAFLAPEKQAIILQQASENKWTVRETREAVRAIKRGDDNRKQMSMPEGTYQIIYADPPWKYDFSETENRKIENQYPTMDIEELCLMKIPETSEDALLLLWATAPKLPEAMRLIQEWNFKYITHGIWDKEKIGMGYWFRGQHELLIIATRGKFSPPEIQNRNSSVYREKREGHSNKPEYFYKWIESAYPNEKKIELFARNKRTGWDYWGNEYI